KFVADYVQVFIKQAKIVSLSWGNSVFKVIDQFKLFVQEDLIFTQFIGENGKYNSLAGSTRLVQKAAESYEASYLTLSIPLYIINDTARNLMSLEPLMSKTISTAIQTDLLISGIGTPNSLESVDIWKKHKNLLFPNM
ncbi:sugar-binding domain-containing protein, partial [Acinetobacter baumannii]|uniref:sugar-binding domain-containing protein n=1 Tax=Acinetobacter baumannii TaxID=470 RepID=UPI001AEC916B